MGHNHIKAVETIGIKLLVNLICYFPRYDVGHFVGTCISSPM
jgi:hypothetical protein